LFLSLRNIKFIMKHLTWLEIDLDAIAHNFHAVRERAGKGVAVMGVVKADAYGHGAPEVAEVLEANGADFLGVATLDEAIQLRNYGISIPILILGGTLPWQARDIVAYNITPAVFCSDTLKTLSYEARRAGKQIKVHLKIETGMGRYGLFPDDSLELAREIVSMPNLVLEGAFTHFSTAGTDREYLHKQWHWFNHAVREIKNLGIQIPYTHVATSAVLIDHPDMKLNLVRPGLMLYGLYPNPSMKGKVDLQPALSFKARIVHVKKLLKPLGISYDKTHQAFPGDVIATLAAGYADGYSRFLSNRGKVLIKGEEFSVVGRICMDSMMVFMGKVRQAKPGDVAVIVGRQGEKEISVDDIAKLVGTINYEIVSLLGKRHRKVFKRSGKIKEVRTLRDPGFIGRIQIKGG